MFLSFTFRSFVFTVVVVPFTVKSPLIITLLEKVWSPVIVESRFKVTEPEVPPPFILAPATTAEISPVPVPNAWPFQYKEPPALYSLLVVVDGVYEPNCIEPWDILNVPWPVKPSTKVAVFSNCALPPSTSKPFWNSTTSPKLVLFKNLTQLPDLPVTVP